jgi:predicted GIY-YIG superfamily endonuclease
MAAALPSPPRHCEPRFGSFIVIASRAKPVPSGVEGQPSAAWVDTAELDCFVAALLAMTGKTRGPAMKQPAVYIMASRRNGTLYTGVTSNLAQRVWQHKSGTTGFTHQYGCKQLVWYEAHEEMLAAIAREKQIKGGSRARKLALIEELNPDWKDLFDELI